MEADIENEEHDEPSPQRVALVRLVRSRLGDDAGRDWLKTRLTELGTTWTTATKAELRAVAIELIKLLPVAVPEPQETAEPTGDRNVLQEIAGELITAEQFEQVQDLAQQYGVDALALAPMLEAYGAKELIDLKEVHYRGLLGDIIRSSGAHRSTKRRQ